ncbi:actin-like ATPase domain-containing protein [Hesseltinella vesiculosa]|uniref:Actin-like ATPase domain-containing protein n=1 Tax=Hesseltinella vesiculosa TaxID=101127 RepID=A0A1X2GLN8_9FUNG|nr:actin-like ATPase domain-containing protein [Hesseltinella vesiculosa]
MENEYSLEHAAHTNNAIMKDGPASPSANDTPAPPADNNTRKRPRSQPHFRYTSFPIKGYPILPVRNINSNFVRSDVTFVNGNKAGDEALCPNPAEEWQDTIIIHPGSRNLRIGLASEAYPVTVPHVLARQLHQPTANTNTSNVEPMADPATMQSDPTKALALKEMQNELVWRMKNAKRRTVANADSQVLSFNSNAPLETIPDHNDPYRVDWVNLANPQQQKRQVYVGDMAFRLPLDGSSQSSYQFFYPWKHGALNRQDYTSIQAVLGDLETIWMETIRTNLGVEQTLEKYNAVLVIPDVFDRSYVTDLINMMLEQMKFRAVIVQQASTCATYGAGASSACVVDIGAHTTSVVCIDEGVPFTQSKQLVHVGGDDITKTFTSFLIKNQFPYQQLDVTRFYDWSLVQDLKEKWCTMNEAEISVQVYDFFVRAPHKHTLKYQCKVYDEVFLAPLCLVYPTVLDPVYDNGHKPASTHLDPFLDDTVNNDDTDMTNYPDAKPHYATPIDLAIAQSILSASSQSEERLKRLFTNIILVGGGGKISNFDRVLEDRLLSTFIARQHKIENVEVLPAPKELDPQILVWKGAAVLCKLDIAKEMWIGLTEWLQVGDRLLQDRSMLL